MRAKERAVFMTRLAHDVGKYVARAARNIPASGASSAMVAMLATDLYELAEGRRASAVFAELARALGADPRLERVRALLAEADAMEERLRAADRGAVARGVAIALEVEALLREAAREARGAPA